MALLSHNVATLRDRNGKNDIECEVNKSNEGQDYVELRVKDGNGKWIKSYIAINELYGLIFTLVDKEQQDQLMPIRQTQVRIHERQHRIKVGKDMKRGEYVIANCRISVPVRVEENIRALMGKKYKSQSGILIPVK